MTRTDSTRTIAAKNRSLKYKTARKNKNVGRAY